MTPRSCTQISALTFSSVDEAFCNAACCLQHNKPSTCFCRLCSQVLSLIAPLILAPEFAPDIICAVAKEKSF